MSDMSSLSHEYASAADFARHINDAVLLLKKRFLGGSKFPDSDKEKLEAANTLLISTLQTLLHRIGQDGVCGAAGDILIPEDVLLRIKATHQKNWGYVRDDLTRVIHALSTDESLDQNTIALLDSICEAADASASATFRKLWRR
jgi:hypothetical protein